ncbi:ABC transporter permease subunit [Diplocloster agilis]|uniref:ABC transporter permease subunit n=1 Tax=Diplocloster agilis TaxID=2850323 RepID=UPI000822781D|nr:ABC transporter permease subunit [Suonthocola fibrivorans]MCU6734106.1 ABC transporter permease [Suonthocola fibrivorans]SCJ24011.1 ABC-type transport system involved in multi-copper enzyme maturation%2C permease component [uncultured Clostridium sp.]
MNKLLNANLSRLFKSRVFLVCAGFMAVYAVVACLFCSYYGIGVSVDVLLLSTYGLGGMITVAGIVMAALCSMFIGTEFSDGTIRNKLVVGHGRIQIYLANFITCAIAGIVLNLVYGILICAIGIPMFGGFQLEAGTLLCIILDGLLIMVSYAAMFNLLAMLLANKTTASVISLIGVVVVMCLCAYLILRLSEPQITDLYNLVDGEYVMTRGLNPYYIEGSKRTISQFVIDLLPSGQSLQLSGMSAPYFWPLSLYSLGVVLAANTVGILAFRKKDLK